MLGYEKPDFKNSEGEYSNVRFAQDTIDNSETLKTNEKIKNRKVTGKPINFSLAFILETCNSLFSCFRSFFRSFLPSFLHSFLHSFLPSFLISNQHKLSKVSIFLPDLKLSLGQAKNQTECSDILEVALNNHYS